MTPASRNASGTHPSLCTVSRLYFSTMGSSVGGLKMSSYLRNFRPRRRTASATLSNGSAASFLFLPSGTWDSSLSALKVE